ncbi:Nif3-like dinuclear metal center hexameric protein [Paeniglutamicibacter sp. R2-26]|uniref:Nif3-like dinuclear metal center hexameric protein n=1 Tax=Paeniglutamicibacter sp. R2-26 TaxID=3144417 RepID=UPI003EE77546
MQSNKGQPHGMRIVSDPADSEGVEPAVVPAPDPGTATAVPGNVTTLPGAAALAGAATQAAGPDGGGTAETPAADVADGPVDDQELAPVPVLTTPTLGEVMLAIEELWPSSLAESWDAVGPVVGRPERPVRRIMFAVDPTLEVIADAVSRGTDLLVTHHPLLLKSVNSVAATGFKGEAVHLLIESGCALVTAHTNADSALGGVSDVLADLLGVTDTKPLAPSSDGLPEEGIGRVGMLPEPMQLQDFASRVFSALPSVAGGVRVAGERAGIVRKVAVCGGAGDSLFDAVRAAEADVYVTADLRHHPASEAREASLNGKPYLIDVSHFASEWLWLPSAADALVNVLHDLGHAVEAEVSNINSDPWDFILTP